MSLSPLRRPFLVLLLAALLALGVALPGAASSRAPDRIPLPDDFQPEGITIGHGHFAYLGSLVNGDIYRANLRTGSGKVVSKGPGTPSTGLKIDQRHRLFVSGGPAGDARVVDVRSGDILASYTLAGAPTFINDVVLTRRMAWFTDSFNAALYGVPLGRHGSLPAQADVVTLPLTGDWVQVPGAGVFNANGIEQTPDHKALLVIQSATGFLFRVDPSTGDATRVDLGATVLTSGDGLLLHGRTLYVGQNINQVSVLRLDRTGGSGRLVKTITSPDFDVPTTVARDGGSLYLPNARFGTTDPPPVAYWITRVHR